MLSRDNSHQSALLFARDAEIFADTAAITLPIPPISTACVQLNPSSSADIGVTITKLTTTAPINAASGRPGESAVDIVTTRRCLLKRLSSCCETI